MNIFTKIKRDHDEARDTMDVILKTPAAKKRLELFKELKVAILSHAVSEEKTFYQALKKTSEAKEVPYMKEEHEDVEALFEEIEGLDADSPEWWEKFGELHKGLTHHMEEEEEKIFEDAKKEIPAQEAEKLGEVMDTLEEKEKAKLEEKDAA